MSQKDLDINPPALGKVAVLMGGTSAEREVRSTARAKARSSPRSARAGEGVAGVASSFNPSNMPRLGFSPWTRPGAGRSIGFGLNPSNMPRRG